MKPKLFARTAMAGAVIASCGGSAQEPADPVQDVQGPLQPAQPAPRQQAQDAPPNDAPLHPELPQIRSAEDMKKHAGERAEIHGEYMISRTRSSIRPVTIVLADGTLLLRAPDMDPEEERLQDKQIVIVGTIHLEPASGRPTLTVETLVLAPQP